MLACFEHDLGAVDVGFDRVHRRFDDQLDADGGGEMDDDVAAIDELGEHRLVRDGVDGVVELRVRLEVRDVVDRSGRQIVEREDFVAALEQRLGQMRADEARAARYQTHACISRSSRQVVSAAMPSDNATIALGGPLGGVAVGGDLGIGSGTPVARASSRAAKLLIIQDSVERSAGLGGVVRRTPAMMPPRRTGSVVRKPNDERRNAEHRGVERDGRVHRHDGPARAQERRQWCRARQHA